MDQKDSMPPHHDPGPLQDDDAARFFDLSAYPLMLNIEEVADICRCDHQAVRRRIDRGELAYTRIGSLIRVPREALREYLLTRTHYGRDTPTADAEEDRVVRRPSGQGEDV